MSTAKWHGAVAHRLSTVATTSTRPARLIERVLARSRSGKTKASLICPGAKSIAEQAGVGDLAAS